MLLPTKNWLSLSKGKRLQDLVLQLFNGFLRDLRPPVVVACPVEINRAIL